MSTQREYLNELLDNFLIQNDEIHSLIISDYDGKVIAGVKKAGIEKEVVSILSIVVNPILQAIQDEFAFKKFGTATFDTENNRLLFISISKELTLNVVLDGMASVDNVAPYAFLIAEKSAQILEAENLENIQINIPMFEHLGSSTPRLKEQVYELQMDSGGIYRFKFIVIGSHEVGKTSIIRRYVENKFSHDYRTTIGLNILSHSFTFLDNEVRLTLWDVGAQKYFKRYRKTYYLGAQAAFIVFDLTRRESYEDIKMWIKELDDFIGNRDLPIVLIGNKSDLEDKRAVDYKEGVQLASKLSRTGISRISYIETSAKTGDNIPDAFSLITYHFIMQNKSKEEIELNRKLYNEIKSILDLKEELDFTFISQSAYWSPGLQIITGVDQLHGLAKLKDEKEEKLYKYDNGLILRNYLFENFDITQSDAILAIFDARGKAEIAPQWREHVIKILEESNEKCIVFVGIRVLEDVVWSKLIEQFNIGKELEEKVEQFMFFKIEEDYREEIYEKLLIILKLLDKVIWMEHVS